MRLLAPLFIVVGVTLQALAICMMLTALAGLYFYSSDTKVFLYSALLSIAVGGALLFAGLPFRTSHLLTRQMFLITGGSWLILPWFACLPLMFGSTHLSLTDAWFETVSGLTTTGSTVIIGLASLPREILIWRSVLQWLGGIGIICMAVALLPFLRIGGMRLFQTESSHWSDDNAPRARQLVVSILQVYSLLTVVCILAYRISGMDWFNAFNHALATVSTGGFSTSDTSFVGAALQTQWVGVLFMLAGSLPFVLYLALLHRQWRPFFTNPQVLLFLGIIFSLSLITGMHHFLTSKESLIQSLTLAAFNLTSIITTTGFASTDYTLWSNFMICVVFFAMFIGGCSGSTSGGIKVFRIHLLFALTRVQLLRTVHPKVTRSLFYYGKPIREEVITALVAYVLVMLSCLVVITLGLGLSGLDLVSSLTGAATALMNVGPGLGNILGPMGNFASLEDAAKWLLAAGMLLGRLEFLTIIILFTPSFWRG